MKRKVMKASAFILTVILAMSMTLVTNAAPADISGHWAEKYMQKLIDLKFMSGYGDGTYKPDNTMNRAEIATLINRIFGYTEKSDINYRDVSSDKWYADQMRIAKQAGYFVEIAAGEASADWNVTKQQMAAMVNNIYGFSGFIAEEDNLSKLNDSKMISPYAQSAVNALVAEGILVGDESKNFQPLKALTRAEASTIIAQTIGDVITSGTVSDKTFEGNVLINSTNVVLKNVTIKGNLLISKGVNGGKTVLENVNSKTLIAQGSSEITADNRTNIEKLVTPEGITYNSEKIDEGKWVVVEKGIIAQKGNIGSSKAISETGSSSYGYGGSGGYYYPPSATSTPTPVVTPTPTPVVTPTQTPVVTPTPTPVVTPTPTPVVTPTPTPVVTPTPTTVVTPTPTPVVTPTPTPVVTPTPTPVVTPTPTPIVTPTPTPVITVTEVIIAPSSVTIPATGGTQQFSATVKGTGGPAQTVTWSIDETGLSSGTGINATTGFLTVDAADAGRTFTIRAISTEDTSKSGTAVVTVENKSYVGIGNVVIVRSPLAPVGSVYVCVYIDGIDSVEKSIRYNVTYNGETMNFNNRDGYKCYMKIVNEDSLLDSYYTDKVFAKEKDINKNFWATIEYAPLGKVVVYAEVEGITDQTAKQFTVYYSNPSGGNIYLEHISGSSSYMAYVDRISLSFDEKDYIKNLYIIWAD